MLASVNSAKHNSHGALDSHFDTSCQGLQSRHYGDFLGCLCIYYRLAPLLSLDYDKVEVLAGFVFDDQ